MKNPGIRNILLNKIILLIVASISGCSFFSATKYEAGLQKYEEGKYYTAIEYFTRAIWDDSTDAELYFFRGNAKAKLDLNEEAIQDYTTAIKLDPEMKYYKNRGLTYLEKKEYKNALKDFNLALSFGSENSVLYFNRGYAKALTGNYNGAIRDYSKAISFDPTNAKIFVNRGDLWANVGEDQKAIADFNTAISINNKDELAFFNRAKEFSKLGYLDRAIEDFSEAILLNPSEPEYFFLRAELKVNTGDFLSAATDYTEILELEPDNGNAYYNRGICYANLEMKEAACEDFTTAGDLGFFEAYEVIKEYCGKEIKKNKKK